MIEIVLISVESVRKIIVSLGKPSRPEDRRTRLILNVDWLPALFANTAEYPRLRACICKDGRRLCRVGEPVFIVSECHFMGVIVRSRADLGAKRCQGDRGINGEAAVSLARLCRESPLTSRSYPTLPAVVGDGCSPSPTAAPWRTRGLGQRPKVLCGLIAPVSFTHAQAPFLFETTSCI